MDLQSFIKKRNNISTISTSGSGSLLDFMKRGGKPLSPTTQPTTTYGGIGDFAKELPSSGLTVLRWIGKQLMKPVGTVAKTSEAIGLATAGEFSGIKKLPVDITNIIGGKKEYSFTQLWTERLPNHPIAANIIGLVSDIAADPTNFVGGGTSKLLSLGEKGLQKVPLIGKVKPLFSTKTGVKSFDVLLDTYRSLGEYRKADIIEKAVTIQKDLSKLPKGDIIKVSDYLEKGIKSTPEVNVLGQKLQNTYKAFKGLEKELGIKGGELAQYAPHFKPQESLVNKLKNFIPSSKEWSTKLGGSEGGRTILKFVSEKGDEVIGTAEKLKLKPIISGYKTKTGKIVDSFLPGTTKVISGYKDTAGKIFKASQASISEISEAFGKKFFEENPAIQLAQRGLTHTKAVTSKEFFNAAKVFAIKNGVEVTAPELKGIKFAPEIASKIDAYYKGIQPEELKVFVKGFDAIQNWWKGQVLIAPSYHIRNMVGNIWNNFLAGVKNPIDYIQAGMLQSGKGKNLKIAGMSADELITLMKKRGVINQGWYSADIPTAIESGIKNTWQKGINPLSQQNYAFKTNKAIGSAFENNARIAHFISKLKSGSSIDDAVMSVKKYLFDYTDLTNTEKNILKRVIPFYTWTRKNIPLQLENLIRQPEKYAGLEKGVRAIENISMGNNSTANEKYLSDYIKSNTAMRVGYDKNSKTYYYFLLGNWLPAYQAFDFLSNPIENLYNMITPVIKTPLDVLTNQSFFKDSMGSRELIENYPGETTNFLGFNISKKAATVLRNIRILNEIDKLNPGQIFGGKKGEPSIFKGVPSVNVPGLGIISPSKYKYSKTQPTVGSKTGALLTGKLQEYNVQEAKGFYDKDTQDKIKQIKTEIRKASQKGDNNRIKILKEQLNKFIKIR